MARAVMRLSPIREIQILVWNPTTPALYIADTPTLVYVILYPIDNVGPCAFLSRKMSPPPAHSSVYLSPHNLIYT